MSSDKGTMLPLTKFERVVWGAIPSGRENRISRKSLVRTVGANDRDVRGAIASLRKKGYPAMSMSNLGYPGYWRPNPSEMERDKEIFIRQAESRIKEIEESTKWATAEQYMQRGG